MKFWLVWNPKGQNPQFRHDSYLLAEQEAKRLASSFPREEFYVIEVKTRVKYDAVRVELLAEPHSYGTVTTGGCAVGGGGCGEFRKF